MTVAALTTPDAVTPVVTTTPLLETPALLLRSGIGGPAVGQHLHLHPSAGVFGVYADEQRAWWGPPQDPEWDRDPTANQPGRSDTSPDR